MGGSRAIIRFREFDDWADPARWSTPSANGDHHHDKPRPPKALRVADLAPDSTAARFTAEDWSRMAAALELRGGERGMLFQVVKGLVASMSDAQIEYALDISHGTMRRYMQRLFKHFQAHCRGEIAMKAVEAMIQHRSSAGTELRGNAEAVQR